MVHLEGDTFYVTASNLLEYANNIYGPDVNVEYFLTDTLFFRFPYENFKKVPLVPISTFSYKDQYMPDGELVVEPDSVLIYGEPMRIENIHEVYTRHIKYYDLSEDIQGVIPIEKVKGVRVSETDARYRMGVKRFVEVSVMLPVKTINVPQDKVMRVYPSVVEAHLKCNFPLADDPVRGVQVEADYNDYLNSLGGNCILKAVGLTRGVIGCDIDPIAVSCVIEDR